MALQDQLKGLLANPLTKAVGAAVAPTIKTAITTKVLPAIGQKLGRYPLVAIGGTATGLAAGLQYASVRGVKIPDKYAQPVGLGIMLAGIIAGQAAVTPVAAPKLTAAQVAKAVIVDAPKKAVKKAKGKS